MTQRTPQPGFSSAEYQAMAAALDAALLGPRGANPLVGAAVVNAHGQILHVGHHRGAGTPHAEVDAITQARAAGTDLREATMVVTLEPCDHRGRTGPCSHAILEAGIQRVIYAAADSTAAAGGAETLRQAGVHVARGLMEAQAVDLNHRWFRAQEQRRPFVTVKTAQSLDARIAAADGTSQWITGEAARAHAHAVRGRVDAILVGTQTVFTDDPRLTVRGASGTVGERDLGTGLPHPGPLRVAMGHRTVPATAKIRGTDGRFRHLATHDPFTALEQLYDDGVRHLLVEGGATVVGAFLAADLTDDLWVYQAPVILGAGRGSIPDLGVQTLREALRFRPDASEGAAVQHLGDDLVWHLEPDRPLPSATTAQPYLNSDQGKENS
ncbi:bifunctional diaminohydroxyphosphoribosylaminopyrimidine deaminase/5-amino-6-(5-phosphoribosylamino)uracil reductase RibD [Kocuria sp.]|uniref:bifunctional diaminohydroxyphosphoribosylaminopyrimidine deaminase/5-amino-6-(5-phosphoribosylamino)uracil reductase RibD n=1 Tax=Kocuria sp. TaxID=1871328 RepID=UPI0026DF8443|nr:bifunctional diaminohydroxyphosphoribosylaminopyrimidine deaminase/5-amino-6-(5-phosphoribosylamino)uracil reductase RibD [Kocuria sp.]MDO5619821.1 bifunctional diaminohydroxyphosphoribosylaminopyrimidine deaminase/5-amino-6-(5-phosphoribosylamino)uracil reductase RibD [Kocuria sp.]